MNQLPGDRTLKSTALEFIFRNDDTGHVTTDLTELIHTKAFVLCTLLPILRQLPHLENEAQLG